MTRRRYTRQPLNYPETTASLWFHCASYRRHLPTAFDASQRAASCLNRHHRYLCQLASLGRFHSKFTQNNNNSGSKPGRLNLDQASKNFDECTTRELYLEEFKKSYSTKHQSKFEAHGEQSQLMAVSVQAPFYSKPGMWNLGDPPTAFSSTGSEGIPVSMSYQYPLESSSNIHPGFHHPPLEHTQSPSPSLIKATSPNLKSKTASGANKSAKIRKSMSTPNVRGQASADAAALALSAEKRRNKLGYHRTSVACGKISLIERGC